jgi:hypothetical protein
MRGMIVVAGLACAGPALAGYESVYTQLDLQNPRVCTDLTPAPVEGEPNDGVVFECKGHGNQVVSFVEGDLRSMVSYGTESGDHCSRTQTFGGFNGVGKTIEWRLKDGTAIATIFRWTVSYDPEDSSKTREWLVVTKLEAENSCHMAYVEGAYPNANAVAQKLVDGLAEGFSCAVGKPIFVAKIGTDTEGIAANEGCQR